MLKILIIDDDRELSALLSDYLKPEGFDVAAAFDGESGLSLATSGSYGFVVLDIMLPGLGGFEVLRRLRAVSQIPVLMLTARGSDIDRILGLEIGADDYLPKPFNPQELVARIRAIQRRMGSGDSRAMPQREVLTVDNLSLDIQARCVKLSGREIELTSVEFGLLEELIREAGKVVTRERLSKSVLGRKLQPFDRALDMHVSNLRKKLAEPSSVERIQTVRGAGYIYTLSPVSGQG